MLHDMACCVWSAKIDAICSSPCWSHYHKYDKNPSKRNLTATYGAYVPDNRTLSRLINNIVGNLSKKYNTNRIPSEVYTQSTRPDAIGTRPPHPEWSGERLELWSYTCFICICIQKKHPRRTTAAALVFPLLHHRPHSLWVPTATAKLMRRCCYQHNMHLGVCLHSHSHTD